MVEADVMPKLYDKTDLCYKNEIQYCSVGRTAWFVLM